MHGSIAAILESTVQNVSGMAASSKGASVLDYSGASGGGSRSYELTAGLKSGNHLHPSSLASGTSNPPPGLLHNLEGCSSFLPPALPDAFQGLWLPPRQASLSSFAGAWTAP